jgi:hypothetical protein
MPGRLDRYLGRGAWEAQTTGALTRSSEDNLDRPLPGDRGARGGFGPETRRFSLPLWLRLHPAPAAVLGVAALAGAVGLHRVLRLRD